MEKSSTHIPTGARIVFYRIEKSPLTNYQESILLADKRDWDSNMPIGKGDYSREVYLRLARTPCRSRRG